MEITRKSAISKIQRSLDIPVNPEDFIAWQAGYGSIDDLMPYLTIEHREFILSGITPKEWDEAFLNQEMAFE